MSAEMLTAVGALILGLSGLISAILLNRKTVALLEWRMQEIERKLDGMDDSNTADRIARMETDIAVIKTKLDFLTNGMDGGAKN